MRTVLYTLLGCERRVSVVKFCFLPTRKSEGGYHQSKTWRGRRTNWGTFWENSLETPELQAHNFLEKVAKKPWNIEFHGFFMVDSKGFEPSTSRMRTERSPNWATSPSLFSLNKSYLFRLCNLLECLGPCYVAFALPAELRAHIGHFSSKKVAKNGFSGYSFLRGKSGKSDCWLERDRSRGMCVHMDANVVRSQGGKFSAHGLRCMVWWKCWTRSRCKKHYPPVFQ